MFCIISAIVLSILGIFSASNRQLAREAFDCVLRRVTLRPCNTGFDEKMKAKILGVVITRSEGAAAFLNKRFEIIAWVFFITMLAAGVFFVRGLYLFYTVGSCEGLNSSNFCVFDPTGANNQVSSSPICKPNQASETTLTLDNVNSAAFPTLNLASPDKVIMVGCYHCDYTRKAYPDVRALVKQYGSSFAYFNFPVKEPNDNFTRLAYCVNKLAPNSFWQFNDQMFAVEKSQLDDPAQIDKILKDAGADPVAINACVKDPQTGETVQKQIKEVTNTGLYGTPSTFINGTAFVGPKPYRVYAIALKGFFFWLK